MSLGSLIAADRGDPVEKSVVSDLGKALGTRAPDQRAKGWHPSSLMDMCPRFETLKQLINTDEIRDPGHSPRTQMIFDVGNALHEWWQEQYFGPMQVLKGKWRCVRCGYVTSGMVLMPNRPHACGEDDGPSITDGKIITLGNNRSWKFDEVRVTNDEWGVVGHSDGIYVLGKDSPQEEEVVLDIKTAGPTFWAGGGRVYPSNIFQVNIYMWLLGLKKSILLYVDKGGAERSLDLMCKEVEVLYNDTYRKDACLKIDAYRHGVKTKTLPSRMATCELRPSCAKAKGCPAKAICLSDKKSASIEKAWGIVETL